MEDSYCWTATAVAKENQIRSEEVMSDDISSSNLISDDISISHSHMMENENMGNNEMLTDDEVDEDEKTQTNEEDITNMMVDNVKVEEINAFDITTNLNVLAKNLCNEEEFRSINHSEPIHIFLKLKPLNEKELSLQNNQVTIFY